MTARNTTQARYKHWYRSQEDAELHLVKTYQRITNIASHRPREMSNNARLSRSICVSVIMQPDGDVGNGQD
jgi:hypothetical protein